MWQPMQAYLAGLIDSLPERPKAILLVSGHWEEDRVTVHTGSGQPCCSTMAAFPSIPIACAGTRRARPMWPAGEGAARRRGFPVGEERARGWDHGVFIPMMVAVPGADIPLVQLSLRKDLDPAAHIAIGRRWRRLRDEGVLIVGSGHELPQSARPRAAGDAGRRRMGCGADRCGDRSRSGAPGGARGGMGQAAARHFAHPREEHLLPLMVALGAGGEGPAVTDYRDHVMGWAVSGFGSADIPRVARCGFGLRRAVTRFPSSAARTSCAGRSTSSLAAKSVHQQ
jgi:4,5-DOPA dioxygenase extradiol